MEDALEQLHRDVITCQTLESMLRGKPEAASGIMIALELK